MFSKYDVYTTVQSMYCYPDTDVLINKLGIRDKAELKQAEEEFTAVKQMALLQDPIKGRFTKTHLFRIKAMHLPAELCKMQRKKRETDGFSKSTWMTPPGSHPTSGFGARHGLPKFFRHKKRRIVQNDAANWWT